MYLYLTHGLLDPHEYAVSKWHLRSVQLFLHNKPVHETNKQAQRQIERQSERLTNAHTHNRFTALLESVRDHPGEQVPES